MRPRVNNNIFIRRKASRNSFSPNLNTASSKKSSLSWLHYMEWEWLIEQFFTLLGTSTTTSHSTNSSTTVSKTSILPFVGLKNTQSKAKINYPLLKKNANTKNPKWVLKLKGLLPRKIKLKSLWTHTGLSVSRNSSALSLIPKTQSSRQSYKNCTKKSRNKK